MSFYEMFVFLCEQKGVKPGRAATECNINRSNVTSWKKNGYTPRGEVLQKLASYFGVSADYLLGYDLQAKTDLLSYQIAQAREELRTSSDSEKEEIEYALAVMEESYDDLIFAQHFLAHSEKEPPKSSAGEQSDEKKNSLGGHLLTKGEIELLELFRLIPEDQQKAFLEIGRVFANSLRKG